MKSSKILQKLMLNSNPQETPGGWTDLSDTTHDDSEVTEYFSQ